jgi:uncharacterized protein
MNQYSFFIPRITALLFAAIAALPAFAQQAPKSAVAELSIGIHLIKAEVAATEEEREHGLMLREKLGPNDGMLFLFDAPATVCMWMKNTILPLSVAFLDDKGAIINIEEMKEQTTDSHCALKQASSALEMNRGWFKQKNIKPGAIINGIPQPGKATK